MENKCTCERPDDNTCEYCEKQQEQSILEKAKENAWSDYEYTEGNLYSTSFKDGFELGVKWQKEQKVNRLDKVKRVEVIQHSPPHNGRAYTNYNAKDVEIQFQDDGKTLKIFLI